MSKSQVSRGDYIAVIKASVSSDDVVVIGDLVGVAITDTGADGKVTIATTGVFNLEVEGTTGSDSAVAVGDTVYAKPSNGDVSKTVSHKLLGKVINGTVVAGGTGYVDILLTQ